MILSIFSAGTLLPIDIQYVYIYMYIIIYIHAYARFVQYFVVTLPNNLGPMTKSEVGGCCWHNVLRDTSLMSPIRPWDLLDFHPFAVSRFSLW